MTVSSQTSRNDYVGNGATVAFPVTFRFLDKTQLRVLRTVIATNVTTQLTLDSLGADGFSVVGAGQPSGGTVTVVTAPQATERLSILRNVPLTQLTDYLPNDPFPAESHERALDKLTMAMQQQGEVVDRAVVLAPQTTGVSNELPGPVALNLLRWKADLSGLENAVPPQIATVAPGAVVDATVSPIAGIQGSKLNFIQSGTGAVNRDVQAKQRDTLNVKDFGAVVDGVTDDTLAFQRGINEAIARKGILQLPGGTMKITPPIVVTGQNWELVGSGQSATIITSSTTTGDVLTIGDGVAVPASVTIRNLRFTSSVARASGASLRIRNGFDIEVEDVSFDANQAICLQLDGGANQYLYRIKNLITFTGSIGMLIGRSGGTVQNVWWEGGTVTNATDTGVLLENVSGMFATNTEVLTCNKGIATYPAAGQQVKAVLMEACFVDSSVTDGLCLLTNGGDVRDCNFSSVWAASNGKPAGNSGILVSPGTGTVKGINFTNPRVVNNGGHGINILGGTDIHIVAPQVFSNSTTTSNTYDGIHIAAAVSEFQILGGASGMGGEFATNPQRYGINLDGGVSDNYTIIGVDVRQNTTAGMLDGGSGTNKHIAYNLGARTQNRGQAQVLTGQTTVVVNHGLGYTPAASDIQLTALTSPSASGVANWWVGGAPTSTQFTIAVNAAATAGFFVGWWAGTKGA